MPCSQVYAPAGGQGPPALYPQPLPWGRSTEVYDTYEQWLQRHTRSSPSLPDLWHTQSQAWWYPGASDGAWPGICSPGSWPASPFGPSPRQPATVDGSRVVSRRRTTRASYALCVGHASNLPLFSLPKESERGRPTAVCPAQGRFVLSAWAWS